MRICMHQSCNGLDWTGRDWTGMRWDGDATHLPLLGGDLFSSAEDASDAREVNLACRAGFFAVVAAAGVEGVDWHFGFFRFGKWLDSGDWCWMGEWVSG